MTRSLLFASLLLCFGACQRLDPAPTDLNDLAHFFFVGYDSLDPDSLADGAANLASWYAEQASNEPSSGTITDLTRSEIAAVRGSEGLDLTYLVGVYHLSVRPCPLSTIEAIYLSEQQLTLFPDAWTAYTRSWHSGPDCYPESCEQVRWVGAIEDSVLSQDMSYELESGLLRRPESPVVPSSSAHVLSRTWMPEAATIGGGSSATFFDHSYQIEVFLPLDTESTLHFNAIWNAGGMSGIDPDAPILESQNLDSLLAWDERIDTICTEGLLP